MNIGASYSWDFVLIRIGNFTLNLWTKLTWQYNSSYIFFPIYMSKWGCHNISLPLNKAWKGISNNSQLIFMEYILIHISWIVFRVQEYAYVLKPYQALIAPLVSLLCSLRVRMLVDDVTLHHSVRSRAMTSYYLFSTPECSFLPTS